MVPTNKVPAIIPEYNEARYISSVLSAFCETEIVSEIIVLDDNSLDTMVENIQIAAVSDKRIQLLCNEKNLGNGQSLLIGREVRSS